MKKALFFCLVLAAAGCTSTPVEPIKPIEGYKSTIFNEPSGCTEGGQCIPLEIQDIKKKGP